MRKTSRKSKETYRDYGAEFNRALGDNIRGVMRRLEKAGLIVTKLPHLTTLLIRRPMSMSWADFTSAIRSELQPRIGGVFLTSSTGRMFVCSNKGNRPGRFVRYV
ncbi:hypothetical protein NS228_05205 [Methylobacterium indicum]|uniref:hypothetical protein n=1 Tax=Methylobacterium indicum TaxID=1775910 RepID=UPI000733E33D|nr:hypothetical protein [Methylobacterium indicum]KTS34235.1 hypothetical protein NS229_11520 [Methylobacterium indicum]KTS41780.1 hypothetical protein NS228_05205 [Methylobacterium indicum]KTS53123.1 hypothetical protein NS230_07770 [Methylobacterium indicum]